MSYCTFQYQTWVISSEALIEKQHNGLGRGVQFHFTQFRTLRPEFVSLLSCVFSIVKCQLQLRVGYLKLSHSALSMGPDIQLLLSIASLMSLVRMRQQDCSHFDPVKAQWKLTIPSGNSTTVFNFRLQFVMYNQLPLTRKFYDPYQKCLIYKYYTMFI